MNQRQFIFVLSGVLLGTVPPPFHNFLMDAAGPADFRDLAPSAGLTAKTIIGGDRTKQYILETTGGGTAILDYDDDGWPDIFLVNGAPLEKPAGDAAPMSHLYRNSGDGTFADVTATNRSPSISSDTIRRERSRQSLLSGAE